MSLEVVGPLYGSVTLQGPPKSGRRVFGVPPGGAFDLESFRLANTLIGNSSDLECLELAMAAFTVRAVARIEFGWVGAGAVQGTVSLTAGDSFTFSAPRAGCRSYVSMSGGATAPEGIGAGCVLSPGTIGGRVGVRSVEPPRSLAGRTLRVVAGSHARLLPFDPFISTEFKASHRMDRVGVRLEPTAFLEHGIELVSEPSVAGAIQVTPSGDPIILGPDGPTIGGYPKIAVVIRADLPVVAQLRPGDRVTFGCVTIPEARELDRRADAPY